MFQRNRKPVSKWQEWRENPFNWAILSMGLLGCALLTRIISDVITAFINR